MPPAARRKRRARIFRPAAAATTSTFPAPNQLELKKEILRETLSRLGRIQLGRRRFRTHSAEPYGYRNRAQWAVRDAKPMALGYFLPESSVIVPIDDCPVLSPTLHKTFEQAAGHGAFRQLAGKIQEIEAFADSTDEKIALNVAFERFPKPAAELAATFRERRAATR